MPKYFMSGTRWTPAVTQRSGHGRKRRSKGAAREMAEGRFEHSGLCDDAMMDPSRSVSGDEECQDQKQDKTDRPRQNAKEENV